MISADCLDTFLFENKKIELIIKLNTLDFTSGPTLVELSHSVDFILNLN